MPMSPYMKSLRARVGHTLLEIPSVSVIVRDDRGRVLLVEHEDAGVWTTPGGAIEPNEVPADAAVRETWEETGLHVQLTGVTGVFGGPEFETVYRNGDRVSYLMVVFEGLRTGGSLRPDREETLDLRFFAPEEARAARTPRWLGEVLEGVFAGSTRTAFRAPRWSPPPGSSPDRERRS